MAALGISQAPAPQTRFFDTLDTIRDAWRNGSWGEQGDAAYRPWRDLQPANDARGLIQAAILASNAHNAQPWLFCVVGDLIAVVANYERHLGAFDPFRREMHQSLGCALENMVHAGLALGLKARIELPPGRLSVPAPASATDAAAVVRLEPTQRLETELSRAIPHRHTHRGAYRADREVPDEVLAGMSDLAIDPQVRLFLLVRDDRARLARLIVSTTKEIVDDAQMAADNACWFRFDRDAIDRHRDGLTLDANVVPPLLNVAAKLFPPSGERANQRWLRDTEKVHVGTAPLLAVIAVRDPYDRPTALRAGMLWQRLHLWLTAQGLVAQPLNQPAERVDRERELDAPQRTAESLRRVVGAGDWQPTFIFRAGFADRPARMSPRREVEAVLATP
jgi:hypothetical protein